MKINLPENKSEQDEVILTKENLSYARSWLKEHGTSIPTQMRILLLAMLDMCEDAQVLLKHNKKLVELLRQSMGFIPLKEREDKKEKDKSKSEEWDKDEENSLRSKMKKATDKWREYKKKRPPKEQNNPKIDAKDKINNDEINSGISEASNDGIASSGESVFQSPVVRTDSRTEELRVDRETLPTGIGVLSSNWRTVLRYNFSLLLTSVYYKVETLQNSESGFSKSARIEDGPPRFKVTWDTMAQIVLLVVGMCMPMVRLASCLSVSAKYFNPSRIYRMCLYAAHACFAIYRQIFIDLASCPILSGDDTHNVVLQMRTDNPILTETEMTERKAKLASSRNEVDPQKIDLLLEAEEFLGSQMPKKLGDDLKKSIFTTVVIGQRPDLGSAGTLVFYHSERKSFGDVIGKILAQRESNLSSNEESVLPADKKVVIQSDLSSSNTPNPLPKNLSLIQIGCGAHARRPFWRYRKDPDPAVGYHCYTMLLLFDKIFDSDRDARATHSTSEILRARQEEQKSLWDEILAQANEILNDFAPNSDMGKAANYIINNFKKLTHYLTDYRLRPDNNHSERLLRYEKTMLDNSKFRVSKRGRLVYDILRTILATCNAARISPFDYIVYLLKNQVRARAKPSDFTPYAFAQIQK